MRKIILTGGIASGKTEASKIFVELGVPVIDADKIAHDLLKINTPCYLKVIEHFMPILGKALLMADGNIDRKKLGQYVFSNIKEKIWLEYLLHPLIFDEINLQMLALEHKKPVIAYCVIDIPVYAEIVTSKNHPVKDKFKSLGDRVLVIDLDEVTQKKRLLERYQKLGLASSEAEIQAIFSVQVARDERNALADDIIVNNKDLAYLRNAIVTLHKSYCV